MIYYKRDELYHHGILGQKWGKQNGPPYPLGASDHSASEKKAGWRSSLAKNDELSEKKRRGNYEGAKKNYKQIIREERQKEIAEYEKTLPKDHFGLNSAQKKRFAEIAIGSAAVVGVGAAIYLSYQHGAITKMAELSNVGELNTETAKKVMLQTLSDGDQILKKGDVIHRMSAYADIDYTNVKKPLYTAFAEKDIASYMVQLKDWHKTGERYDVTFEALKDLKVPSEEKARKVFKDLWDSDPIYREKLGRTVIDAYIKLGVPKSLAETQVRIDLYNDPFKVAIYSMVKNKEDTSQWIAKLKDAGYDAIIDYFDKGVMADYPLIVLDPSGSLQKTGETLVTRKMKLDTLKRLKDQGFSKLPGKESLSIDKLMDYIDAGIL